MDKDLSQQYQQYQYGSYQVHPQQQQQQQQQMMGVPMFTQYMQYQPQQQQQQQVMGYVQQPMNPNNVSPFYMQDTTFRNNYVQQMMPQMMQQPQQPMFQVQQQPQFQQPKKQYGQYNDYDDDEDLVDDEPSSEEAEFTDDSDMSEEDNNDDIQEDFIIADARRNATREHTTIRNDDDVEEEEEEFYEVAPTVEELKVEHIYISRIGKEGIEYLVRFQNATNCLLQWIPELILQCLENANYHLNRFRQNQIIITGDEEDKDKYETVPIAHRVNDSVKELLYRITLDDEVHLYWDTVDEETFNSFASNCCRVNGDVAAIPTVSLPEPTPDLLNHNGRVLSQQQLDGVNWLISCWKEGHGSVLADDARINKPVEVISFLQYLTKNTDWKGPFIIIANEEKMDEWDKILKEESELAYINYSFGPEQRKIVHQFQFPFHDEKGSPIKNTYSFNVLLVNQEIYLEDKNELNDIRWQCLIVDDDRFVKEHNTVLSTALSNQRIVITDTPIQNTLKELWTILYFIAPSFFEGNPSYINDDIEGLPQDKLAELKAKISKVLLRRSLQDNEPKKQREHVAFISLTEAQRDLIRLVKLNSVWRLKGIQEESKTQNPEKEEADIENICSHPFLLENAEEFYTSKFKIPRVQLLKNLSSKMIWIGNMIESLKPLNHKVIIISDKIPFLHNLCEFCILSGFKSEILTTKVSEEETNEAIERFGSSNSYVFLMASDVITENLNLSVADDVFILDPKWNPLNNFQATDKEVTIYHLITYQTCEHRAFAAAQNKLKLWDNLVNNSSSGMNAFHDMSMLEIPPALNGDIPVNPGMDIASQLSTVIYDYTFAALPKIENQMSITQDFFDSTGEQEFLNKFPVSMNSSLVRRTNTTRSNYDNFIDSSCAYGLWDEFKLAGYGSWETIANKFQGHSDSQIEHFCQALIILCFRSLPPTQVTQFPFIVKSLSRDIKDFSINMLLCSRKGKWNHAVPPDHELNIEIGACKPLKETIYESGYDYLTIIEIKLTAKAWLTFNDKALFNLQKVPPNYTKADGEILESILTPYSEIDPYDDRVQAFTMVMRQDIIQGAHLFAAQQFSFWSLPEYQAVVQMMSNFTYSFDDPIGLHMKTGILSKTTEQVVVFTNALHNILKEKCTTFPINLPQSMTLFDHSPEELIAFKNSGLWTQMQKKDYLEINKRMAAIKALSDWNARLEQFPETTTWSNYHTKKLFESLLQFGLDQAKTILLDKKIGLVRMLNKHDRRFVEGKLKTRIHVTDEPPVLLLSEEGLIEFFTNSEISEKYFRDQKNKQYDYVPPDQHYEYNWEDSEEESSDADNYIVDDSVDQLRMRRNDDDEQPFTHLLESDD